MDWFFLALLGCMIPLSLSYEEESCFVSHECEDECGTIFYPIVKPLLKYFETCSAKNLKFEELQATIREKDNEIKILKDQLDALTKSSEISEQPPPFISPITESCSPNENATTTIYIPGRDPFQVICRSGWIVVLNSQRHKHGFNRTFENYKVGFGDPEGEYFIGLERLYLITTSVAHELRVISTYFPPIQCDNFEVSDEDDEYAITSLEGCSGDPAAISLKESTPFSTYDRDQDGQPDTNLAAVWGRGWWYNGLGGVPWSIFDDSRHQMMIRTRN